MAKTKRVILGGIYQSKDKSSTYMRTRSDVDITIPKGSYINRTTLEDKRMSLDKALEDGKLSKETVDKIKAGLDKGESFGQLEEVYFQVPDNS